MQELIWKYKEASEAFNDAGDRCYEAFLEIVNYKPTTPLEVAMMVRIIQDSDWNNADVQQMFVEAITGEGAVLAL